MFVGHLAAAFAAKRLEPKLPLAALVAATFGLDVIWPVFIMTGVETVQVAPGITAFTPIDFVSYPWSHSLLLAIGWGGVAVAITSRRRTGRMSVVIGALVVSHWVLDWISHRPDLPLWPGGPKTGLGLWYSIPATIAVEGALLAIGVALYVRVAPARDRVGVWALWSLVAVTAAIWLSGPVSPPPPSVLAIGITGIAGAVVFVFWARWIERHRG